MENKRISINFGLIITILIILILVGVILQFAKPYIKPYIDKNININFNKKISVSSQTKVQKFVLYDDKKKMQIYFPNQEISANIYYNLYGKIVVENDEYIDFSKVKVEDDLIEKLKPLTNIKEINLRNQNLDIDTQLMLKKEFPNVHFIWEIDIAGQKVDSEIEELDLTKKKVKDVEEFKKALTLLTKLKKLNMSDTNLTNEQLGELREQYPNIRIDWVVYLGKWYVHTDDIAFSVLITDYNYRRMTAKDIEVLKYCTELQALDLGHQAIEDISVIGEYLPNLRILILADNKIKDISCLSNLKHLHFLELFMNDITDASSLASCKELVDLNISFNYHFSDISGILDLPMLERLWLISDRISKESYDLIKQTYPNVKLVTTGSGSTESGWRTHERYFAMIDMFRKRNYIHEAFSKYDR